MAKRTKRSGGKKEGKARVVILEVARGFAPVSVPQTDIPPYIAFREIVSANEHEVERHIRNNFDRPSHAYVVPVIIADARHYKCVPIQPRKSTKKG